MEGCNVCNEMCFEVVVSEYVGCIFLVLNGANDGLF